MMPITAAMQCIGRNNKKGKLKCKKQKTDNYSVFLRYVLSLQ